MNKTVNKFTLAVKNCMNTPHGRELLNAIVKETNAVNTPVSTDNTNLQYYNLGRQSVGQQILRIMEDDK